MTVLFDDVHEGTSFVRGRVDGLKFTELLYADDTALVTSNVNAMNRLVTKIESNAAYYGLNFNQTKCVSMSFNTNGHPSFSNGVNIPSAQDTPYLGSNISATHDVKKDVSARIGSCFAILSRMQSFWSKSNCPTKFKLDVFDAVIRSKLVYGLDVVQLPQSLLNKLDAFQLKGLRKILKLNTTFINRGNTNKHVFELANNAKNPKEIPGKHIKPFSEYISNKQENLLKHTIRASGSCPLRQCTLEPGTAIPHLSGNRRVGRPRDKWADTILRDMHVKYGFGTKSDFKSNYVRACTNIYEKVCSRSI